MWSLHSSLFLRTVSRICVSCAAWAAGQLSPTDPLRVRGLSAPHSKLLALCWICPLVEALLKARQDRGFSIRSAGLEHPKSSKHNHQLLSELTQSMVYLHLLSSASLSCSSKATIFSDCNNTPGLKSPTLKRFFLPLLWGRPPYCTTSYKRPQSFLFSVLLGKLWDNSMRR